MKHPLPLNREPRVTLISLVASRLVPLDLLPGVLLGSLDRFRDLDGWRLLKLELRKYRMDLRCGI